MARLRFPGRPGNRIGRPRVPYSSDGPDIESDPTFRYISHIKSGLQNFREAFGDSDEDEEFLGFTERDVRESKKRLAAIEAGLGSSGEKKQPSAHQQRNVRKKVEDVIQTMADEGLVQPVRATLQLDSDKQPSDRSMRMKGRMEMKKIQDQVEGKSDSKGIGRKGVCKTTRVSVRTSKIVKVQSNFKRRVVRPKQTRASSVSEPPETHSRPQEPLEQTTVHEPAPTEQADNEPAPSEQADNEPAPSEQADNEPAPSEQTEDNEPAPSEAVETPAVNEPEVSTRSSESRRALRSVARDTARSKLSNVASSVKPNGQNRAKMLLERAKRTGAKKDTSPKSESLQRKQTSSQKREFHLPATSTRSSRKIIPNKRFLLEETIGSTRHVKSPKVKEVIQGYSGECVLELGSSVLHSMSPVTTVHCAEHTNEHQGGLLDQPLIVDGKRERKPSVKLIQKLSEEYVPERKSPSKSPEKSSRADRKCLEIDRDIGATQRSGKIILQKAKFRLNQAALNRSKAALACSLKAQMYNEDRQLQTAPSKDTVQSCTSYSSSPPEHKLFSHFGLKPTPPLVLSPLKFGLSAAASETAVFGASSLPAVPKFALESTTESLPTFQSPNKGKPEDTVEKKITGSPFRHDDSHVRTMMKGKYGETCPVCTDSLSSRMKYYGVYCCRSCARFYRARILDIAENGDKSTCQHQGNCTMSTEKKFNNCYACRYKVCQKVFPKPENIRELHRLFNLGDEQSKLSGAFAKSPEKCSPGKAGRKSDKPHTPSKFALRGGGDEAACTSGPDDQTPAAGPERDVEGTPDLVSATSETSVTRNLRALLAAKSLKVPEKLIDKGNNSHSVMNVLISTTVDKPTPPTMVISDANMISPAATEKSPVIVVSQTSPRLPTTPDTTTLVRDTERSPQRQAGHGPRIKHVCRRAAVALGVPATFPSPTSLTLSALPTQEKQKILSDRDKEERPGTPDSDDMSMDEIIRQAKDDTTEVAPPKRTPNRAFKALVPRVPKGGLAASKVAAPAVVTGRRRVRCNKCAGCNSKDCGTCVFCKDKPKFGGIGKMKQACMNRRCKNPQLRSDGKLKKFKGFGVAMKKGSKIKRALEAVESGQPYGGVQSRKLPIETFSRKSSAGSNSRPPGRPPKHMQANRPAQPTASPRKPAKAILKPARARQKWLSGDQSGRVVNADFKEDYDIDIAWKRGIALISSTPMCVRTVCLLCGNAGKEELIFCNVCCEPFHSFCLDPGEAPKPENLENWCCRRCHVCHVCGRPNNDKGDKELLHCNKCQETYHPHCLWSNHPTKPSKHKKIWLCTKCVRCKSCGATTPGPSANATWMYDFSLCHECGILMDKGNYCPVCHKCYSDDDWESKMIQCLSCQCWVHSKCEEMTDEMYQIFSFLPEDIDYRCRVCSPQQPPPWLQVINKEMEVGFKIVIDALLGFKCSVHLESITNKDDDASSRHSSRPASRASIKNRTPRVTPSPSPIKPELTGSSEKKVVDEGRKNGAALRVCETDTADKGSVSDSHNAGHGGEGSTAEKADHGPAGGDEESEPPPPEGVDDGHVVQKDLVPASADSVHQKTDNSEKRMEGATAPSANPISSDVSSKSCKGDDGKNPNDVADESKNKPHETDNGSPVKTEVAPPADAPQEQQEHHHHDEETAETPMDTSGAHNLSNLSSTTTDSAPETAFINAFENTTSTDDLLALKTAVHATLGNVPMPSIEMLTQQEGLLSSQPKEFPLDLAAVRSKLAGNNYDKVDEFCSDIVRIIQFNMKQMDCPIIRKKACNTIRSSFLKTVYKCFPWYNLKSTLIWGPDRNLPENMLPDAVIPPSSDHTYAQWLVREEKPVSPQPSPFKRMIPRTPRKIAIPMASLDDETASTTTSEPVDIQIGDDNRRCVLCTESGDGDPDESGRLLYAGQDDWVHINCALWSAEVYEEVDGTLQNVQGAMARGKKMKCDHCSKAGATVGCCQGGCPANFHFVCAKIRQGLFQEDKKMFCSQHFYSTDGEVIKNGQFSVQRRTCIEQNPNKWMKKTWQRGLCSDSISVVIGSMTVENLGRLGPLSDRKAALCPINFCVTRVYWSTRDPRRRCVYTCRIIEVNPHDDEVDIVMKDITVVHEEGHADYNPEMVKSLAEAAQKVNMRKSRQEKEEKSERERRMRHGVGDCKYTKCDEYFIDDTPKPKRASKIKQVSQGGGGGAGAGVKKAKLGIPYQPAEGPARGRAPITQQPSFLLTACTRVLPKTKPSLVQTWKDKNLGPGALSSSYPGTAVSSPTPTSPAELAETRPKSLPDLTGLSPSTLKLLGQTDLSKFAASRQTSQSSQGDLVLNAIADRLNMAAAKNRQRSVERTTADTGTSDKTLSPTSSERNTPTHQMASPPPVERMVLPPAVLATASPACSSSPKSGTEPMDTEPGTSRAAPAATIPQVDGLVDDLSDSGSDDSGRLSPMSARSLSPIPQLDGKYDEKPKDENCGGGQTSGVEGRVTRRMSNGPLKAPVRENTVDGAVTAAKLGDPCKTPGTGQNGGDDDSPSSAAGSGGEPGIFKVERINDFEAQYGKAQVILDPTDIPLHDKIAQKIKAESLARSSPSEPGGFKCRKCKRTYRTEHSLKIHMCNFEVSTDEEDDDEEEGGDAPKHLIKVEVFPQSEPRGRASRRLSHLSRPAGAPDDDDDDHPNGQRKPVGRPPKRKSRRVSGGQGPSENSAAPPADASPPREKRLRGRPRDPERGEPSTDGSRDPSPVKGAQVPVAPVVPMGSSGDRCVGPEVAPRRGRGRPRKLVDEPRVEQVASDAPHGDDNHPDTSHIRSARSSDASCTDTNNQLSSAVHASVEDSVAESSVGENVTEEAPLVDDPVSAIEQPEEHSPRNETPDPEPVDCKEPAIIVTAESNKVTSIPSLDDTKVVAEVKQEEPGEIVLTRLVTMSEAAPVVEKTVVANDPVSPITARIEIKHTVAIKPQPQTAVIAPLPPAQPPTDAPHAIAAKVLAKSVHSLQPGPAADRRPQPAVIVNPVTGGASSGVGNITIPGYDIVALSGNDIGVVEGVAQPAERPEVAGATPRDLGADAEDSGPAKMGAKVKTPPKKKVRSPTSCLVQHRSPVKSVSPTKLSPKFAPLDASKVVHVQNTILVPSGSAGLPGNVRILPKVVSSPPPVQQTFTVEPNVITSPIKQYSSPGQQVNYVSPYTLNAESLGQGVTIVQSGSLIPAGVSSGVTIQPSPNVTLQSSPNVAAIQQSMTGIQVLPSGVVNIGGLQQQIQPLLVPSSNNSVYTTVSLSTPVTVPAQVNCNARLLGSAATGIGSVVQATPLYDQTQAIMHQQALSSVRRSIAEQQMVSPTALVQQNIRLPAQGTILTNQINTAVLSRQSISQARTVSIQAPRPQTFSQPQPQFLGIAKPPTRMQTAAPANAAALGQKLAPQNASQMLKSLVSQKVARSIESASPFSSQTMLQSGQKVTIRTVSGGHQQLMGGPGLAPGAQQKTAMVIVSSKPPDSAAASHQQLVAMTPAGVPSRSYHQGMLSHADLNPKVQLKRLSPKKKAAKNPAPLRPTIIAKRKNQLEVRTVDINEMKQLKFESSLDESIKQTLKAKIANRSGSLLKQETEGSAPPPAGVTGKVRVAHAADSLHVGKLRKEQSAIAHRVLSEVNRVPVKKRPRKDAQRDKIRPDLGHAHPLIHPTHQSAFLPEPEQEEEVEDSPLLAYMLEEEERKARESRKKDAPYLVFEITSDDGFKCQAESVEDAWKMVTDKVQDARSDARMKQLSFSSVKGLAMLGLIHDAVIFLVEQLYGAENCRNNRFKFHEYERVDVEEEPEVNPSGCARGEPFISRRPFEMFSFLLSRYRLRPSSDNNGKSAPDVTLKSQRRTTSLDLPMAMRYRHLRSNAREAVGVYRSGIHGRGLFCKRDIDAGEMVIEYAGEVIRGVLTDKRESYYESKGIGCYMFRIDDDDVVDATVNGNSARFINHSCDPNCFSKVIQVDNKKHIVIFAQRPIKRGEELTYDYKFPIEEIKIPCTCAAKRCRKFLN